MDKEALGQQTYFPAFTINGYIEQELRRFDIVDEPQTWSPFMPAMSTNIDDIYGEALSLDGTLPILISYDTLSRFRPSPMYRHKREQIMYTVHGPEDKVFAAIRVINAALDREDSAAQDVNSWQSKNQSSSSQCIFFHNIKAFQVDESRDLLELASVRGIYRNKIIVQYDYHTEDPLDALYT
jgi:hypothetical protein